MATCIDVSDASYPDSEEIEPLEGKSLIPLLNGNEREGHEELYFRFSSNRALRKGDWKVVSFYENRWELYNLATDRNEQNDLASEYPELVKELSERWHELAENKDQLAEKDRSPVKDTPATNTHREWHRPELVKDWEPY